MTQETVKITSSNILAGKGIKLVDSISEYYYTFEVTKEALAKLHRKGYRFSFVKSEG